MRKMEWEGLGIEEFEAKFKADLTAFAKVVREAHIPMQD